MSKKNNGKTVTKTVHYKIARFNTGAHNLQTTLRSALDSCPTVGSRAQTTGIGDDGKRRVISHEFIKGMLCGWLVDYTPGNSAVGMIVDEDATSLKIENVAPQAKGGKQREYAEGILYFAVRDNHVLVTQSTGLLTSHFERYINWIAGERTGKMSPDNYIMIADQVSNPLKGRRGITGVKAIRISDGLTVASTPAKDGSAKSTSRKERMVIKNTKFLDGIIELIKSLGGPPGFDEVLNPKNVEMTLEIVAKNLRQGTNEPYLDNLAGTFRHCPDVDLSMDLVGGGTITTQDYRISHPLTVPGNGGIPDSTVLFDKMHGMLEGLITEGRIPFNP